MLWEIGDPPGYIPHAPISTWGHLVVTTTQLAGSLTHVCPQYSIEHSLQMSIRNIENSWPTNNIILYYFMYGLSMGNIYVWHGSHAQGVFTCFPQHRPSMLNPSSFYIGIIRELGSSDARVHSWAGHLINMKAIALQPQPLLCWKLYQPSTVKALPASSHQVLASPTSSQTSQLTSATVSISPLHRAGSSSGI